ncbi:MULTISPECIES: hypothetical protein [unclassified Bradyrhizobium]|uniref:hypothetical protein n=1 Tax=unclassified Bradyrhizobium TaxID=2631580 RepID=UPI0029171415|nr:MULTISPECIES: hypothetical protein [unclassified Bradyrhizobium]
MAKSEQNKLLKLMQDMDSPQVIAAIDRALEENEREREDLLDLRKMAVRRHGGRAAAEERIAEEPADAEQDEESAARDIGSGTGRTINDLIASYKNDADSNFPSLSFATREQYEALLRLVAKDHGEERISDLNARVLKRWHTEWSEGGKIAVAHSKIGMVRRIMGYGATMLEDADCVRLSLVLNKLKFELPKARTEKMTEEQANAIRAMAHQKERPSIALAQAFQFDLGLRQKDVIGDWVPVADRGESDLIDDNKKWVRGLRWEDIDDRLILRKQTTFGDLVFDLHMSPMVMAEFAAQFGLEADFGERNALPQKGPVILSEFDNLPWSAPEFRRWWRLIADAAGVPPEIRNSDSRKGL